MKRNWYKYIAAILIIVFVFLYFQNDKDIKIININWDCSKNPCVVSFDIKNQTNEYIETNLSIRALRRKAPANSPIGNRVTGEKIIQVKLSPNDTRTITEDLQVKFAPFIIQVTEWNSKKGL